MDDQVSARLDAIEKTLVALQMGLIQVQNRLGLPGPSTADRIAAERWARRDFLDAPDDAFMTPEQRARLSGG
jgi:hypothetical protein